MGPRQILRDADDVALIWVRSDSAIPIDAMETQRSRHQQNGQYRNTSGETPFHNPILALGAQTVNHVSCAAA
jgi:hypothetical protein